MSEDDYEEGEAALHRGDFARALGILKPLAGRGHAGAQLCLGWMHLEGRGVPQAHAVAAL